MRLFIARCVTLYLAVTAFVWYGYIIAVDELTRAPFPRCRWAYTASNSGTLQEYASSLRLQPSLRGCEGPELGRAEMTGDHIGTGAEELFEFSPWLSQAYLWIDENLLDT